MTKREMVDHLIAIHKVIVPSRQELMKLPIDELESMCLCRPKDGKK